MTQTFKIGDKVNHRLDKKKFTHTILRFEEHHKLGNVAITKSGNHEFIIKISNLVYKQTNRRVPITI